MIWVTWRQFRTQAMAGLAILTAAAIGLLVSGLAMHHTYAADLTSCSQHADCSDVLSQFRHSNDSALGVLQLFVLAVPALTGLFWGAPLIGRELETGTDQLAWYQSVTRARWLAFKLAGVGITAIGVAAVLSFLLTWWAGPLDHITGSRFAAMTFSSRDIVPPSYAAFAFTVGAAAGLVFRRTIPAMAVTLAVFLGLQILVPGLIRPHLLPSTTDHYAVNATTAREFTDIYTTGGGAQVHLGVPVPAGAWVLAGPVAEDTAGQVVAGDRLDGCLFKNTARPPRKSSAPPPSDIATCLAGYHLHESVTYQPSSHYWPLQWAESGIYLALTGALSGFCFWWIRRRRT